MLTFPGAMHKHFGGYCNVTHCCKTHHKTTAKFSSNPTISFSRKPQGSIPREHWSKQGYFRQRPMGSFRHRSQCRYIVRQPPKIYFRHYVSVSAVKCIIVLAQRNIFKAAKNPRKGYRLKISATSFVCNEPRMSIL